MTHLGDLLLKQMHSMLAVMHLQRVKAVHVSLRRLGQPIDSWLHQVMQCPRSIDSSCPDLSCPDSSS